MKLAHNIALSVFINENEDYESIKKTFFSLIPLDIEKEKLKISEKKAKGVENAQIIILSITLNKNRHVNEFLRFLVNALSQQQKDLLLKQYETRIDQDLHFFIRLDKTSLMKKEFKLTDSGTCFHIKIHLATFPESKEQGKIVLKDILSLEP